MRFFRVVMAVLCGVQFLVLGTVSVLAMRANETLLEDDFYVRQLHQADIYNFFYDDVFPPLLDDLTEDARRESNIDLAAVKPQVVSAVKGVFPPGWLEEQSEQGIRQVVPFLVGEQETFNVQVPLRAPVQGAGAAAKDLAGNEQILDLLFSQVLAQRLKDALAANGDAGMELPINPEQLEPRVRRVLDNAWMEQQTVAAVDALIPYLVGDEEHFTVRMGLGDQRDELRTELLGLLSEWDSAAFFTERALDPLLAAGVPQAGYPVPFGITIRREDIRAALTAGPGEAWVRQQADSVVSALLSYILGEAPSITVNVPLEGVKSQVAAHVGTLLDTRLEAAYTAARVCTAEEERRLDPREFARTGITCRPSRMTYQELKNAAGVPDFSSTVAAIAARSLPASFTFSEADVRQALGPEQWQALEGARAWFTEGFVFTDRDLEEWLASGDYPENASVPFDRLDPQAKAMYIAQSQGVQSFNTFRGYVSNGLSYTDRDLREGMAGGDPAAIQGFDRLRGTLGTAKRFSWLLWLLPLSTLIAIGAWGARTIAGKVLWSASFLLGLGVLLVLLSGPLYGGVAKPRIMEAVQASFSQQAEDGAGWRRPLEDKAAEIMANAMDDYAAGIRARGYLFVVVSAIGLGGGIWYVRYQDKKAVTARGGTV